MKHLKRFNEDINQLSPLNELQDFCETNLAYLMDDGAEIEVVEDKRGNVKIRIILAKEASNRVHWDQIKDQMIPFLIRLTNKYELSKEAFCDVVPPGIEPGIKSKGDSRLFIMWDEEPAFGSEYAYLTGYVKDLIAETTGYNFDSFKIYEINIGIHGYKQEPQPKKKSFISKIKSYFK